MKQLKQSYNIPAPAEEVYIALTNPFTIELWSGYPAEMSTEPNSEFSLWEGEICGKNLEFKLNELVKQQWYFEGQDEPSVVSIHLRGKGESTSVELVHENIPDEAFDEMKEGWKDFYFGALKKFFS